MAAEIDEAHGYDISDDGFPTLPAVLEACARKGAVINGADSSGVEIGYVSSNVDDLKYFIRQYGQIIIETKITTQTYNKYDVDITDAGADLGYDEYSKGFLASGYDSSYMYVQNSLGPYAGSLGFHRMSWNAAKQLVLRGACYWLKNPG